MPEEKIPQPENAEVPQPVVEETSVIPKKKKFSNTAWLVIGLVLLIILGRGVYFLLAGKTTTQLSSKTVSTITPTVTSSPVATVSATPTSVITDEIKQQMIKDFETTSIVNKPPLVMRAYVKGEDIKIWRVSGVYAGLDLLNKNEMADGSFSTFSTPAFAKKINGLWTVVYSGENAPTCELLINNKFTPEDIKGLFTNGPTCPSS